MFHVTHTTGATNPQVVWEDDIDSDPVRSSARTGHIVICTAISRWGVWSVRDSSGHFLASGKGCLCDAKSWAESNGYVSFGLESAFAQFSH